jgi:hypothetical protein
MRGTTIWATSLFMFCDPLDFVFPAPTTVVKQRKMDVVGQTNPVKRLPPTDSIATKTPPIAPPAIPAPTAPTPGAASTALEPSATTREVRKTQAQKPVLMDTGAPIVVSSAATKAKKPSKSGAVKEKKLARNKKGKVRKKRSNANKAAELVGVADEVDAPVINVVEIIDSGASSTAAVGTLCH